MKKYIIPDAENAENKVNVVKLPPKMPLAEKLKIIAKYFWERELRGAEKVPSKKFIRNFIDEIINAQFNELSKKEQAEIRVKLLEILKPIPNISVEEAVIFGSEIFRESNEPHTLVSLLKILEGIEFRVPKTKQLEVKAKIIEHFFGTFHTKKPTKKRSKKLNKQAMDMQKETLESNNLKLTRKEKAILNSRLSYFKGAISYWLNWDEIELELIKSLKEKGISEDRIALIISKAAKEIQPLIEAKIKEI